MDTLLFSVSYSGFWGQQALTLDQFIDRAADLGFDGVMLMAKRPHLSVLDYGSQERARLRAQLEKRRMRRVCVAAYTNFTADLEHGEVPHREFQIQYVTTLAEFARDLGGDLVRVFTGYENPASGYSAQWKLVVDTLRECARRAAPYGVTIGVQNHHDLGVAWESQYDLIREVGEPNCRAMFDAWAPALHGVDIAAAARKMASITVHTTTANYQLRPRFQYDAAIVNYREQKPALIAVPIDEGFIDYRAFLGALSEGGFRGTVAYEMCSPLRDGGDPEVLDRYARRFVEFVKAAAATA
ncbi:MAG: sugar phosphate isomerase/epimerase family protein [Bryobacteraceae bacterium]